MQNFEFESETLAVWYTLHMANDPGAMGGGTKHQVRLNKQWSSIIGAGFSATNFSLPTLLLQPHTVWYYRGRKGQNYAFV
jgi:hypothetical protein